MSQMEDDCGSTPAPGGVGLIITDMINDLDYPGSEKLMAAAQPMAERILDLRGQADALGVPVIYVNDNFGQWHSERSRIIDHCRRADAPAAVNSTQMSAAIPLITRRRTPSLGSRTWRLVA